METDITEAAPAASGVAPTRQQILDGYMEWLFVEHRQLSDEMGLPSYMRGAPANTIAASFHFPVGGNWQDVPKPSTRAEAILSSVGVLPSETDPVLQRVADYRASLVRFADFIRSTADEEDVHDAFYDEVVGVARDRLYETEAVTSEAGARECLRTFLHEELLLSDETRILRIVLDWFDRRAA